MKLENYPKLTRIAKRAAPMATKLLLGRGDALSLVETYACILQGKGGMGTPWALEIETDATANKIHRPAPQVLDVGANDGRWSMSLAKKLPRSRFIQIEASPSCVEKLKLGRPRGSTVIWAAASSANEGTATLHSPFPGAGSASLHNRRDSMGSKSAIRESVPLMTIDSLIDNLDEPYVDFMKVDVEGFEYDVLMGAVAALESKRIGALSFEFGAPQINARRFFLDFWDFLRGNDYQLSRLTPAGLYKVESYDESLEYFRSVSMYFAELA